MSDGVAPSKGAWTPGPWRVSLQKSRLLIFGPADRPYWALAELNKRGIVGNEAKANAKLIERAPRMADLLLEMYEHTAMPESTFKKLERLLSELEVKV